MAFSGSSGTRLIGALMSPPCVLNEPGMAEVHKLRSHPMGCTLVTGPQPPLGSGKCGSLCAQEEEENMDFGNKLVVWATIA